MNIQWTLAQIEQERRPADKKAPAPNLHPDMRAFLESIPKVTLEEALYGDRGHA